MLDADRIVAQLNLRFLQSYLKFVKQEIAMKNRKLFNPQPDRPQTAQPAPQHQPWPAHRRFWHRRVAAPAKPNPAPRPRRVVTVAS